MSRKIKPTINRFSVKNSNKIYEIGKVPILHIPMLASKTKGGLEIICDEIV
jgi:hypothetical protein